MLTQSVTHRPVLSVARNCAPALILYSFCLVRGTLERVKRSIQNNSLHAGTRCVLRSLYTHEPQHCLEIWSFYLFIYFSKKKIKKNTYFLKLSPSLPRIPLAKHGNSAGGIRRAELQSAQFCRLWDLSAGLITTILAHRKKKKWNCFLLRRTFKI